MRLLLRDGLVIAVVGVTVGLVVAAATAPFLGTLLAGVAPRDLTSFGLVAAGLLLTALAASYAPARRGTRLTDRRAPNRVSVTSTSPYAASAGRVSRQR